MTRDRETESRRKRKLSSKGRAGENCCGTQGVPKLERHSQTPTPSVREPRVNEGENRVRVRL